MFRTVGTGAGAIPAQVTVRTDLSGISADVGERERAHERQVDDAATVYALLPDVPCVMCAGCVNASGFNQLSTVLAPYGSSPT